MRKARAGIQRNLHTKAEGTQAERNHSDTHGCPVPKVKQTPRGERELESQGHVPRLSRRTLFKPFAKELVSVAANDREIEGVPIHGIHEQQQDATGEIVLQIAR